MPTDINLSDIRAVIATSGRADVTKSGLPYAWNTILARERSRLRAMSSTRLHVDRLSRRIETVELGPPLPEDLLAVL